MNLLTGADALEAMAHLMGADQCPQGSVVVFHQGKRYGGFRSKDHARWFIDRCLGNEGGARIEIVPLEGGECQRP
jgi:hypothetical protein